MAGGPEIIQSAGQSGTKLHLSESELFLAGKMHFMAVIYDLRLITEGICKLEEAETWLLA